MRVQRPLETPFVVESRGRSLRGVLHEPDIRPFPVVLICHGYFQSNRIGPMALYVGIARALAESGVGCVRFDFAGFGESDGAYTDVTYDALQDDLAAVAAYVSSLAVDGRVGLLGHSLGGNICIAFAARCPDIKSLCLLSPNPVRSSSEVTMFTRAQLQELERTGRTMRKGIPASLNVYRPIFAGTSYSAAARVAIPVALIFGAADPYYTDAQYVTLAQAFGRPGDTYKIDDADHNYLPVTSRRHLLDYVVRWHQSNLATSSRPALAR